MINAGAARSWQIESQPKNISVKLPARILNSNLSELSKNKLQELYDDCWPPDELEARRKLIYQRGQLPESAPERAELQKQIVALHRRTGDRLKERAGEILAGSELKLFLDSF